MYCHSGIWTGFGAHLSRTLTDDEGKQTKLTEFHCVVAHQPPFKMIVRTRNKNSWRIFSTAVAGVPTLDPVMVPALDPVIVPTLEPVIVPAREPVIVPTREPVAPVLEPVIVPA